MELLSPEHRCSACFKSLPPEFRVGRCLSCKKRPASYKAMACALEHQGPQKNLILKFKYGHKAYLSEGLAAFMYAQWKSLGWPRPDLIVPIPLLWTKRLSRGFNQSLALADSLGSLLGVPVKNCLWRLGTRSSQAAFGKKERFELGPEAFFLSKPKAVQDKTILLVDDVVTTGNTIRAASEILSQALPENIYALCAARAPGRV